MSAPVATPEQIAEPDTGAIRIARRMVDAALDYGNRREFYRHAAHLKVLKAAARRRIRR
ncbi:hypothetical protein ACFORO_12475 [Amycolatopsis halotolerans]|uniref:Uncharacterized protein n=1 Tax=Amycolatopsis halotolerans TaxID=330083 RepID=A0ABV7QHI9_9PSEU